jgi:hypothetical protein
LQDLHLLQGDQPARHHAIQDGQECVDVVLAVDNLDQQRQVFREPQDFRGVQPARLAEPHRTAQHGGAGEVQLARLHHDRFIERPAVAMVALADEDAERNGLIGNLHGQLLLKRL